MPPLVAQIIALIENFLKEEIEVTSFVDEYIHLWRFLRDNYPTPTTEFDPLSREAEIISHLMVEADAFNGDRKTRSKAEIDEVQLRAEFNNGLRELLEIYWQPTVIFCRLPIS